MKKQVFSSVIWTAAQSWGNQLVSLGVFLVLARLLEPSAFGLMAMAGIYIHISNILVDQGLSAAIIQKKDLEPEDCDTAFWLSVGFAIILVISGILLARPIAALFKEPELAGIIAILSFNFLATSLNGVQDALLRREFRFKLLAIRSLVATATGGVVGIVMAARGHGVMSLVAQTLVQSMVGVALLWTISGWRPGFRFSPGRAKSLSSFGVNIIGTRLMEVGSRRSADLLIGYFLGVVALGYYSVAFKIFTIFIDVFTRIISRVALPAFAAIQRTQDDLVAAFGQAIKFSCLLALPSFVFVGILANEIIPVMFGAKWMPSAPVMQVLTVMGILQTVYMLARQVLVASGRPSWSLALIALITTSSLIGFLLVVDLGIAAVAASYSIAGLVAVPFYVVALRKSIGFTISDFTRYLRAPVIATTAMAVVVFAIHLALGSTLTDNMLLVVAGLAGAFTYAGLIHSLDAEIKQAFLKLASRNKLQFGTARR